MDKQAVVIIPFYKNDLSAYELIALEQCFKLLSKYTIIAIKPHGLSMADIVKNCKFNDVVSFDDTFFNSIQGYNRLMLSEIFYGSFLNYEYMLIYQLDAFVFKDELNYWCSQNIDYVGAPWLRRNDYPNIFKAISSKALQYLAKRYNFKRHGRPSKKQFDDNVGNGGFSLRRVSIFYDICLKYREKIAEYNQQTIHQYHEDVFWSVELNRKRKVLQIPDYKRAVAFAFERSPERSYQLNNHKLPFGCHAWDLHIDYWRPIFKEQGYDI